MVNMDSEGGALVLNNFIEKIDVNGSVVINDPYSEYFPNGKFISLINCLPNFDFDWTTKVAI